MRNVTRLQLPAGLTLLLAATFATPVFGQAADQIIVGPVNVYQMNPDEAEGQDFDVNDLNLRRIYEAMGADATLWHQHVMTLSNPFFEGRAPGLAGNEYAAQYIEFYFREYGLEPAFPDETASATQSPGGEVEVAWTSYRQTFEVRGAETDNVGGVLRGRGDLADEWVVIGAHYDHVGYGNRNMQNKENGTLHPGADDNASGTSGMLVLAKRFTEQYAQAGDDANLRSILFMGFSAEEMGLVGSRHYTRNSTLGPEEIHIMLNLDMIGRLRDNTLLVGGVGSAEGLLDTIRPHLIESGLKILADPSGRGPSDHSSFYGAGVPVLFMFTGVHSVYHQPGDYGYTVSPMGALQVIDLTWAIAQDMVHMKEDLVFTTQQQPARNNDNERGDRRQQRASLGIMPDFNASVGEGVRVGDVFDDSPAAAAGVKVGDIIRAYNGEQVTDMRSLFTRLREAEAGDVVTLTIDRDGDTIEVKVELAARD